jgi:aldehyde:ferredoxin oxidoreductase
VVECKKCFNVREGWKPEDDTLPDRLLDEAIQGGPVSGARLTRERLAGMLRSYNLARGWSPEGHPKASAWEALLLDA